MCSEYIKRVPNIFGVPSLFSIIYINKLKWIKKFKNPISVSKKTHLVKVRENMYHNKINYSVPCRLGLFYTHECHPQSLVTDLLQGEGRLATLCHQLRACRILFPVVDPALLRYKFR